MNAFMVELENKPGQFARVTRAIADRGIDITGFAGATCGDSGTVVLVTNDEAGTRKALADAGCTVRESEVVTVAIENRPGSLATVAQQLADAGINVEAAMATGMSGNNVHIAFATSDPAKTRATLGDRAMTGAMR
jgi:hypothetical protein